ncbi:hypothetical protein H2248_000603 [Termitomyces sp. 'cryptogamus']|nr:hypothetical protein H2248_000603 [Termitomyces sp. 'cryptogamus']
MWTGAQEGQSRPATEEHVGQFHGDENEPCAHQLRGGRGRAGRSGRGTCASCLERVMAGADSEETRFGVAAGI